MTPDQARAQAEALVNKWWRGCPYPVLVGQQTPSTNDFANLMDLVETALRAARAEVLVWTKQRPTQEGQYWYRQKPNNHPEMVYVEGDGSDVEPFIIRWECADDELVDRMEGEWCYVPFPSAALDAQGKDPVKLYDGKTESDPNFCSYCKLPITPRSSMSLGIYGPRTYKCDRPECTTKDAGEGGVMVEIICVLGVIAVVSAGIFVWGSVSALLALDKWKRRRM